MPTKKSVPRWHAPPEPVVARLSTPEEAAAALMSPADPVEAVELPGENTNVPRKKSRKRSRIHEVFEEDPTDRDYSICQCLKSDGGGVCSARINRVPCFQIWPQQAAMGEHIRSSLIVELKASSSSMVFK